MTSRSNVSAWIRTASGPEVGQDLRGPGEQEVAGQDRDRCCPSGRSRSARPRRTIRLVHHVVVVERRQVGQLDDRGRRDHPRRRGSPNCAASSTSSGRNRLPPASIRWRAASVEQSSLAGRASQQRPRPGPGPSRPRPPARRRSASRGRRRSPRCRSVGLGAGHAPRWHPASTMPRHSTGLTRGGRRGDHPAQRAQRTNSCAAASWARSSTARARRRAPAWRRTPTADRAAPVNDARRDHGRAVRRPGR